MYTMEFHAAGITKQIMTFSGKRVQLEVIIILNEIRQTRKGKCCMFFSHMWNLDLKLYMNENVCVYVDVDYVTRKEIMRGEEEILRSASQSNRIYMVINQRDYLEGGACERRAVGRGRGASHNDVMRETHHFVH